MSSTAGYVFSGSKPTGFITKPSMVTPSLTICIASGVLSVFPVKTASLKDVLCTSAPSSSA